jgi:glycosyltransferase involved in cell wall biosynthesis
MTNEIWLSILVPVYNVEHYLADCILSMAQQAAADPGIEIIMAEDVSTDGSRAIAEGLCDQYPGQLKLVYQDTNQGLSAARNRLLDEASGEYVWFVDSDDYLLDGAVDQLRNIVAQHRPDIVLCDYRKGRLIPKKGFFGPTKTLSDDVGQLVTGVFKSRKMYSWLKISRRSLWGDCLRFPVGRAFEDIATTPRLLLRASSFYYAPKAWLHYRQRPGSIMGSVRRQPGIFDETKHRDMSRALLGFKELLPGHFPKRRVSADYHLADFCAKEFTKTSSRILRAQRNKGSNAAMPEPIQSYLIEWQACSPIAFEQLAVEYAKRLRLIRYTNLKYYLHLAKASRISVSPEYLAA